MNVAFISIDNCKKYSGVTVSIDGDKRGFHRGDNDVVVDFMSAISYAFKKQACINLSSSIDDFIKNHKKYKLFEFESSKVIFRVIAPAKINDKEKFIQYLATHDVYNVPEGYESCYFIVLLRNPDGSYHQKHLFRQYPVIDGKPFCYMKKQDRELLGYIYFEPDEKRDMYKYYDIPSFSVSDQCGCGWIHHRRNYSDSISMKHDLEKFIRAELKEQEQAYMNRLNATRMKIRSLN